MKFCFMKGFEMGGNVMRSVLEEDAAEELDTADKKSVLVS